MDISFSTPALGIVVEIKVYLLSVFSAISFAVTGALNQKHRKSHLYPFSLPLPKVYVRLGRTQRLDGLGQLTLSGI